jgi:hypothetical protein
MLKAFPRVVVLSRAATAMAEPAGQPSRCTSRRLIWTSAVQRDPQRSTRPPRTASIGGQRPAHEQLNQGGTGAGSVSGGTEP